MVFSRIRASEKIRTWRNLLDLSQIGELAAIGAAFCWTITALFYQEAGGRVGSRPVTFVRLPLAMVFLSLYPDCPGAVASPRCAKRGLVVAFSLGPGGALPGGYLPFQGLCGGGRCGDIVCITESVSKRSPFMKSITSGVYHALMVDRGLFGRAGAFRFPTRFRPGPHG